jgi:signal transduction histidine kinase
VLDDLGLAAALESLASSVTERGVACDYFMTGEPYTCAPEVEVTVYRIAQEGVTNTLRHAEATHVAISLAYAPESVEVLVHDDGRGFDVSRQPRSTTQASEVEKKSSLGLLGMRERAALVGATLDVESAPGEGTRVRVHVPLAMQTTPAPLATGE